MKFAVFNMPVFHSHILTQNCLANIDLFCSRFEGFFFWINANIFLRVTVLKSLVFHTASAAQQGGKLYSSSLHLPRVLKQQLVLGVFTMYWLHFSLNK